MKKMKTLFIKDGSNSITAYIDMHNRWVFEKETVARIKLDGTACAVIGGKLYKRYDCKLHKKTGKRKIPPEGWIPCQELPDPITGHWPGWVPVTSDDKYHLLAFNLRNKWEDGTYELIGECINGNPQGINGHMLVSHNTKKVYFQPDFSYGSMFCLLLNLDAEGLVFYGKDGQMCKLRRRDFGLEWPIKE